MRKVGWWLRSKVGKKKKKKEPMEIQRKGIKRKKSTVWISTSDS